MITEYSETNILALKLPSDTLYKMTKDLIMTSKPKKTFPPTISVDDRTREREREREDKKNAI